MTSTHDNLDFISSICSNFADALNNGSDGLGMCGQDAYEVLTLVFGDKFSENDLRAATLQNHQDLAEALATELEFELASPQIARESLEHALRLWS